MDMDVGLETSPIKQKHLCSTAYPFEASSQNKIMFGKQSFINMLKQFLAETN